MKNENLIIQIHSFCSTLDTSEYIDGDKFASIAHFAITEKNRAIPSEILQKNCIVFCKTDFLNELFLTIKGSKKKYILITHNSDHHISEEIFKIKPRSIHHWFAQNCTTNHKDITPIPIGLEREHVSKGLKTHQMIKDQWKNRAILQSEKMYINFNIATNDYERRFVYYLLKYLPNATCKSKVPYSVFLDDICHHRFILSPPGNGIDCHRTWESLYLGTFPVIKAGDYCRSFNGLPIITYNNILELRKSRFYHILQNEISHNLNLEKLKFSYWKKLILTTYNYLPENQH